MAFGHRSVGGRPLRAHVARGHFRAAWRRSPDHCLLHLPRRRGRPRKLRRIGADLAHRSADARCLPR
eukprot:518041-Alexandrium_andersonii.AAC.1